MNTNDTQSKKIDIAKAIGFKDTRHLTSAIFSNKDITLELWNFIIEDEAKPLVLQDVKKQKEALDEIKKFEFAGWENHIKLRVKIEKSNADARQNRVNYLKELAQIISKFTDEVDALDDKKNTTHNIFHIPELKKIVVDIKNGSTLSI